MILIKLEPNSSPTIMASQLLTSLNPTVAKTSNLISLSCMHLFSGCVSQNTLDIIKAECSWK